jgi:hypothetical protein
VPSSECRESLGALSLASVAVDEHSLDRVSSQCRCNPTSTPARATKHHDTLAISIFDKRNRQGGL